MLDVCFFPCALPVEPALSVCGLAIGIRGEGRSEILPLEGSSESRWHSTQPLDIAGKNQAVVIAEGGLISLSL